MAITMHRLKLREISRSRLENEVIPEAQQFLTTTAAAGRPARDILANIEERSQLLVERGFGPDDQPVMAFSHLTFQEFLAATALRESTATRGEPLVSRELLGEYDRDTQWWEEVALLYAAQLAPAQQRPFLLQLRGNVPDV